MPTVNPTVIRDGETVRVHVPMAFKRQSGRKEIILPESCAEGITILQAHPQPPLLLALARAHRWPKLLDEGAYEGVSDLACAFKVDPSYVGRVLRLTLRAPDIIQAIVDGREPDGLSLRKLMTTFPAIWEEQPKHFGLGE